MLIVLFVSQLIAKRPKLSKTMELAPEPEQTVKLRIIALLTTTRILPVVVPTYSSLLYSEREYGLYELIFKVSLRVKLILKT